MELGFKSLTLEHFIMVFYSLMRIKLFQACRNIRNTTHVWDVSSNLMYVREYIFAKAIMLSLKKTIIYERRSLSYVIKFLVYKNKTQVY